MGELTKPNRILSVIYGLFLSSVRMKHVSSIFRGVWNAAWDLSVRKWSGAVNTVIHGQKTTVNYGYNYPVFSREFPTYNSPLVELAYQAFRSKGSPIVVADIGAAVGDTILLIDSNCPGMMSYFYCIDGDERFFSYLEANLAGRNGKLLKRFLSSSETTAKALVRIHPGTASSQGDYDVKATSLDILVRQGEVGRFDLLKTDVDGYDGVVLQGARECLRAFRPVVLFEWHPELCAATGNSVVDHFTTLDECGYDRFLWFDNYGHFSHFSTPSDVWATSALASICISRKYAHAVYFDIVALHRSSSIPDDMAELNYARPKRSPDENRPWTQS